MRLLSVPFILERRILIYASHLILAAVRSNMRMLLQSFAISCRLSPAASPAAAMFKTHVTRHRFNRPDF